MASNYAEREDSIAERSASKKYFDGRSKATSFENYPTAVSAKAAKSSLTAEAAEIDEMHHRNGLNFDEEQTMHDVASMVSSSSILPD